MSNKVFGIKVCLEFSAAHHIRGYDGECARPHGHNFRVEVKAQTAALNPIGIALDFKEFKKIVKTLIDRFDHQDLNMIEPFTTINPTAETLSQHFFEQLENQIASAGSLKAMILKEVTIWENDRSAASFELL